MPELPEVQTVVDDLNKKILKRRIINVWFDWPKLIKKPTAKVLAKEIKGARIERVRRRAKNILIDLDQDRLLLIHQKMTGHLLVGKWKIKKERRNKWKVESILKGPLQDKVNNYIHLIFYLDNGQMLGLSDLRKFAKVLFGPRVVIENLPDLQKIGPEPFDPKLTSSRFKDIIGGEKRKIKQVLLDQEVIAGIGNIYSDDILWQARVCPLKPANRLKSKEIEAIFKAMRLILRKAINLRGTSTSDFRDTSGAPGVYTGVILVYQREGEPCRRCQAKIRRVKIGGRSSHYCPRCQRL